MKLVLIPKGGADCIELKVFSQRFALRAVSITLLDYQAVGEESFYVSVVDPITNG